MKKISFILLLFISLLGVFLIFCQIYANNRENFPISMEIPPNLNSQITPTEVFVSPAVPILMYHHIQDYPGGKNPADASIFVSPASFEAQLNWLALNNFQTVNLSYFKNPTRISGKPIVLTFDDGYQDAYDQVFPILKKYGFRATFYPIVNNINKSGFLTKNEILEMQTNGMTFGSHSLSHPNLTEISEQQAEQEIYASKKILEKIIGKEVSDFCYPGGKLNQNAINILANSGYQTATTTSNKVNLGKTDPLQLNRLDVQNDTHFENFPALDNL
ncbi:MAG: polysaccharide deacetylase family protein [Candidatus Moraniibacteriota bacterium]